MARLLSRPHHQLRHRLWVCLGADGDSAFGEPFLLQAGFPAEDVLADFGGVAVGVGGAAAQALLAGLVRNLEDDDPVKQVPDVIHN